MSDIYTQDIEDLFVKMSCPPVIKVKSIIRFSLKDRKLYVFTAKIYNK